jgi:drug/metabolite transporter (DMT)-like permease
MGQEEVIKKPIFPIKWVLLTILAIVWGSSFILMKRGLTVFRPDQLAAIRMSVACFATFPFIWKRLGTIPKQKLKYLSIVGIFGSGIPAFLFATAQTRINSSLAGMLNGLTPVFTMLVGSLFFHSKFTSRQIIGVFIGLLGASGLILLRSDGGLSADFGYAILIVIATLCYGISVNTIKTFLSNIDSITISGAGLLFVGIPYVIYLFSTDFVSRFEAYPKAWEAFGYIATLSLFGTALSGVLYFQLVKISSPLFASVVTYFIPIVALIWGIADGEKLNPFHLLAMVAILGGVTLISTRPKLKA